MTIIKKVLLVLTLLRVQSTISAQTTACMPAICDSALRWHGNDRLEYIALSYLGSSIAGKTRIATNVPLSEPSFVTVTDGTLSPDLGAAVNMTCIARGYPPPTLQWIKDGLPLAGETQPFLYLPEALPNVYDGGNYSFIAVNSKGTRESTPIELKIEVSQMKKTVIVNSHRIHTRVVMVWVLVCLLATNLLSA